jgi:hypothetical protein
MHNTDAGQRLAVCTNTMIYDYDPWLIIILLCVHYYAKGAVFY